MPSRKPVPLTQEERLQNTIEPYANPDTGENVRGRAISVDNKARANQRSVKGDNVQLLTVGLRDIDETIVYYFNNVIRPSVVQNGVKLNVPLMYGSPERWSAVQEKGYFRDKNGKIMTPLIMFKRTNVEKNRKLGNKMDANNPLNFGIFKKRYNKQNIYDKVSTLINRAPIDEYYAVAVPDYVNLTYSCIIFTDYVEQMNKIIESINFASDAYWGDPERFQFRAMIDQYTNVTELVQGRDRVVRTTFDIQMLGHIISDTIQASLNNVKKFYSKGAVSFGLETTTDISKL